MRPTRAIALIPLLAAVAARAALLQPDGLLEWRYVADPRFSVDGSRLAYVEVRTNAAEDRYESIVRLVDGTAGTRSVASEGRRNSMPRFAPDDSGLAFLSDRQNGRPQVYFMRFRGGEPVPLTNVTGRLDFFSFSPDGSRLALRLRDEPPDTAGEPFVTRRLDARRDGQPGYRPATRRRLVVMELATGEQTAVTDGSEDAGVPVWSGDGRTLYFSALRPAVSDRDPSETDIFEVPADGSAPPSALIAGDGPDNTPLVSPDGRWLASVGFTRSEPPASYRSTELRVHDLTGEEPPRLLTGDFVYSIGDGMAGDVRAPGGSGATVQWAPDSNALFFTAAMQGRVQLMRANLGGGEVIPVTSFDAGAIDAFHVSESGTVAAIFSRPDVAPELVSFALARGSRGAWRQVTDLHGERLDGAELAEYEEIAVERPDGEAIQAWLVSPPRFDRRRRYPLILYIHGGPHSMYGTNFFHEFQVLAARGYFVLIANPRGSSGYGDAFGNAVQYRYPGEDANDLLAVLDAVVDRREIDGERLGIAGGSGGGLLTTWIVGKTGRFKAASAQRSVTNWHSFVGTSDFSPFFVKHWFRAPPWVSSEEYLQRSPLSLVAEVTTPVQILHSDADYRTPLEQGLQYYTALRIQGKPAELVVFPGESHGLSRGGRPSHRVARLRAILRWFAEHLSPPG
ncbi:MAG: S9 family peptidase [Pseudomonadota bacterium]